MTALIILAGDPQTDRRARLARSRLAAAGYEIGGLDRLPRPRVGQDVILLWSRTARTTPSLLAAARSARAAGRLVCLRLDAALPPRELGGARASRLPHGGQQVWAMRRLVRPAPRPRAAAARPATRRGPAPRRMTEGAPATRPLRHALAGMAALALIGLAAGAEAYARDAAFAARLQAAADSVQARALDIAAAIAGAAR